MCVWPWGICLGRSKTRAPRLCWHRRKATRIQLGHGGEALQDWSAAANDYLWIGAGSAGCLGPLQPGQCAWLAGDWPEARGFGQLFSPAPASWPVARRWRPAKQDLDWAEAELRKLIRPIPCSPMLGRPSVACSGQGSSGEAESHYRGGRAGSALPPGRLAAAGAPLAPQPTEDLMAFLALEAS